jgi:hypothetical protein
MWPDLPMDLYPFAVLAVNDETLAFFFRLNAADARINNDNGRTLFV